MARNCQAGDSGQGRQPQFDKPARASIDHTRLEGKAYGVKAGNNSNVSVRDSSASGSGNAGFFAELAGSNNSTLRLQSCMSTHNVVGVKMVYVSGGTMLIGLSNVTIYGSFTAGIQRVSPMINLFRIRSYGNNHNSDSGVPDETMALQ